MSKQVGPRPWDDADPELVARWRQKCIDGGIGDPLYDDDPWWAYPLLAVWLLALFLGPPMLWNWWWSQ